MPRPPAPVGQDRAVAHQPAIPTPQAIKQPLDVLLRSGGDHRQAVDPDTGLNAYRISSAPRDGVPFGSCTASWPSELTWSVAADTLARWQAIPAGLDAELEGHAAGVRRRLRDVFDLRGEAKVVLTPSGTDAVFVVSALALARDADRVHHIVVGAAELGSGTLGAAQGDAFSHHRPVGPRQPFATELAGLGERCTAQPVYLRDAEGRPLPLGLVDEAVREEADAAVADGHTAVVHMVAHSKTGLRAPSLQAMRELGERHGERVLVLVDAAQGRVSPVDIRRAIEAGLVVLFTGSKFYSGPPFSGALLVPTSMAGDPGPLPAGLDEWLSAMDLPRSWTGARGSLSTIANPGLLLRWEAALAEIEGYHELSPDQRSRVYHTFAAALVGALDPAPTIGLELPMPPVHELASGLGSFPSVCNLTVRDHAGQRLAKDELSALHAELDSTLDGEAPWMRTRYHLGQPVALGPPSEDQPSVLRVALGSRLVRELSATADSGAAWFREQADGLRRKIEHLIP